MTKPNHRPNPWLIAALSGLAGAAIGLLLAPKSGQATRTQLKETGQTIKRVAQQGAALAGQKRAALLPTHHQADYDAIIIGGGHNGLVTAAYLAKAGRRVLVLERQAQVGGAAVTEAFAAAPEFKFSALADGLGHLSPEVSRDLALPRHGLEFLTTEPAIFAPLPDGRHLTIWRDVERTVEEISRFSAHDAARYPAFLDLVGKISGLVGALATITPPQLPKPAPADLKALLKLLAPARQMSKKEIHDTLRVLPMSVSDFIDEWFESEPLRGLLAARGVTGITWGPRAAGTAYTLLYACAGQGGHAFGHSGVVKGGMGALTQAIAQAAQSYGAEIRTEATVAEVQIEQGRATGVTLASGEKLSAACVISNTDPQTTFFKLVDPIHLDPFFMRQVNNIKYRGSAAKVHLALAELPHFSALNGANGGDQSAYLRGRIQIAPSLNYVEKAADAAKYGDYARQPYLEATIPTLLDPSLAPAGRHVMSVYVQFAAYHLRHSDWEAEREALGQVVIDTLSAYAPNLKPAILHSHVLTPLDLEQTYGLTEGNPNHGEMTLDQFLYMRPVSGWAQYRTPLPGLYLCGAGAHPGGGVTGLPGQNAAREILRDWGD